MQSRSTSSFTMEMLSALSLLGVGILPVGHTARSGLFVFKLIRSKLALLPIILTFSSLLQAQVQMINCQVPENIYVIKKDNREYLANINDSLETIERELRGAGRTPRVLHNTPFQSLRGYFHNFDNKEILTRFAVIVDPTNENISLAINTDSKDYHDDDNGVWTTDYLAFIDGKDNRNALFTCQGNHLQLKWGGRDYSANKEMFASAGGELEADLDYYQTRANQPAVRLRVISLTNSYPPGKGLTDIIYSLSKYSPWYGSSIPLYDVNYREGKGRQPRFMRGMYGLGYGHFDEARLLMDVERINRTDVETSEQNLITSGVGMPTLRAYLHWAKYLMSNQAANVSLATYQVETLNQIMEKMKAADKMMLRFEQSTEMPSFRQISNLENAIDQVIEMSSQGIQNTQTFDSTEMAKNGMGFAHHNARVVTRKVARLMKNIKRVLEAAKGDAYESFLRKSRAEHVDGLDGIPLLEDQGDICPGTALELYGQDSNSPNNSSGVCSETALAVYGKDSNSLEQTEELKALFALRQQCAIKADPTLRAHYTARGENLYGYNTGIDIRVHDGRVQIRLKSDKSPWTNTRYSQNPGDDYLIPGNIWCSGPLFGIDHASGPVRATVRGVFDDVNNVIFAVALWSTWDSTSFFTRVWSNVHTYVTMPGLLGVVVVPTLAAVSLANPAAGVPFSVMGAISAYTAMTFALSPMVPAEQRVAHHKWATKVLAEWLPLGAAYYNGIGMEHFASYSILTPTLGVK